MPAPISFLPKECEATQRHGILMIVDEVQAGFCRSGKCSPLNTGLEPDIIVMSKQLVAATISCISHP